MSKHLVRSFLLSSVIIGMSGPVCAQSYFDTMDYNPFITQDVPKTSFSLEGGVRVDDFDWNIASDLSGNAMPNILSELTWSDITLYEVEGGFMHYRPVDIANFQGGFQLDASVTYGETFDGDNQDSDYIFNNRQGEFSRSNNTGDRGYAIGGEASLGYKIFLASGKKKMQGYASGEDYSTMSLRLMPLIGYGWDKQQYEMNDGYQTIPATGAFDGLSSEYTAWWRGPFAGLEAEMLLADRHMLSVRGKYHRLQYDGEGIWNLRNNFKQNPSFQQVADDAEGTSFEAKYTYALGTSSSLTLGLGYKDRKAEDGVDTTFFTDGTEVHTKLNEANDESTSARIGYSYTW